MTCLNQGIMPSHYFCSVNLGDNMDFHMCLKLLHLNVLSPQMLNLYITNIVEQIQHKFSTF